MKKVMLFVLLAIQSLGAFSQSNIVLLDVSGSMKGHNGENVMPIVQSQLQTFVEKVGADNISIVPFTDKVIGTFTGNDYQLNPIEIYRGNTNISTSFDHLSKMLTGKGDRVFLISDCLQNTEKSEDEIIRQLNNIKRDNRTNYFYLVALSQQIRETPIATVFDSTHNFYLIDSLYLPEQKAQAQVANNPKVQKTSLKEVNADATSSFNWWWLLGLIILVVVVWFTLKKLMPLLKKLMLYIFSKELSASKAIKALDKINAKVTKVKKQKEYDRRLQLLPENVRAKIETLNAREYQLPQKGKWKGKRGNSVFIPDADVMPKNNDANYNPHNYTLREYMRKNCNGKDSVKYIKGEPNFKPIAHSTYKMEVKQETLADRQRYQREAKKLLMNKLGLSNQQAVQEWLNENHLTIHENPDGASFSLIKYLAHESFPHNGGVSKAKNTIAGGGPLTMGDVIKSLIALIKG